MTSKTVKISEGNYRWLMEVAGTIQAKEMKSVSLDAALGVVKKRLQERLIELAGSWKMSDEEAEAIKRDLRAVGKRWKVKYA